MQCPMCQDSNARQIKAGISKKSGKPYDAFIAYDACGFKGQSENGTVNKVVEVLPHNTPKPIQKPNGDPYVEGKEKNTRLMTRKDLMCAVIETYGNGGTAPVSDVKAVFNELWMEIEK